jgi:uridine phosphorylase
LARRMSHEEGLIRPRKRKTDPTLALDALMVMIPSDIEFLLKLNHTRKTVCFDQGFFKIYQIQRKGNDWTTLSGPFLGAPQAVMGMEKLIVLGARRIWALGWCGSLQPDLRVGDLIVPREAVSEEGTSKHYPIGGKKRATDEELSRMLGRALAGEGRSFRMGTVWTTDAPYRETPFKVKAYREKGVLGVEMEMSALMTLAVYRSVRLAAVLVVSDELSDLSWHAGFKDPRFENMSRFAAECLLRLVETGVDLEENIT